MLIIVIIGNGNWPGYRSAIYMISSPVSWKFPISDGGENEYDGKF